MIFINPIAKYDYNKRLQPLPRHQGSAFMPLKADSFKLSKSPVSFKSNIGVGLNLHFPLQEVEELFAKASEGLQKTRTADEKTRLISLALDKFKEIETKADYHRVRTDEGAERFLNDRSHELIGPTLEMRQFKKSSPTAKQCDEFFQYTTTRIIGAIKRYEVFLEKGLDKNNLSQHQVFEMALDSAMERAAKKGITIQVQGEDILHNCPDLSGMFNRRLYTVFSNLIQNAVKYSPKGSDVKIEFTRKRFGDTKYLTFSVADNGVGIPKKEHRKVLNGHRASNAVTLGIDGTGYGIKRVNKILKFCFKHNKFLITSPLDANNKNFPGTKVTCYIKLKDN